MVQKKDFVCFSRGGGVFRTLFLEKKEKNEKESMH